MQFAAKSKIPKIVLGILVVIPIAVIAKIVLPSIWFWIGFEVVSALLVAVGCAGEWYLHHRPAGRKKLEKQEHHRTESRYIAAVAIGVLMEFLLLAHLIPEAIKLEGEAASANERAADALKEAQSFRLKADILEQEMQAMSTNIQNGFANLSPINQPITSVNATLNLFIVGSGEEIFDPAFLEDAAEDTKRGEPADQELKTQTELAFAISYRHLPEFGRNFPWHLSCESLETSLGHERMWIGTNEVIQFKIEFGENQTLDPFTNRQLIWQQFTVGSLETNDVAYLDNEFLKDGDTIVQGTCVLRINQDVKTFSLWRPPQTLRWPLEAHMVIFIADAPATNKIIR